LDILTGDPEWSVWSADALARCAEDSTLAISPIIYAEVSIRFERIEDLEETLPEAISVRTQRWMVSRYSRGTRGATEHTSRESS
jgi:hypothetical protein